jgi:hypothetical protein
MKKSLPRANHRSGWESEWAYHSLKLLQRIKTLPRLRLFQIAVSTIVRQQQPVKGEKDRNCSKSILADGREQTFVRVLELKLCR